MTDKPPPKHTVHGNYRRADWFEEECKQKDDHIARLEHENAEMRRTFGSHPLFAEKDARIAELERRVDDHRESSRAYSAHAISLEDRCKELEAERDAARHCLMLMMQKHKHWVWDLDATPEQAAEMELARNAASGDAGPKPP
jgi:acyl transferase domain-containing protein